jgi:hypothetical protein
MYIELLTDKGCIYRPHRVLISAGGFYCLACFLSLGGNIVIGNATSSGSSCSAEPLAAGSGATHGLSSYRCDNNIKKENIWNMDEKGFFMGMVARDKVVCRKGRQNPRFVHDGNRELITVLECLSATGTILPPLVVFRGKHIIAGHYIKGQGGPGWCYKATPKDWTTNELELDWLKKAFKPLTRPK